MTIETVRGFRYICDGCGTVHLQENADGHYTDSRPDNWYTFRAIGEYEKYAGDARQNKLLCWDCGTPVFKSLLNVGPKDK